MVVSLPPMEIAGRTARLTDRFGTAADDGDGIDALLVTSMVNIRYLTGFTGSAGILLVTPEELLLVTDGRYGEQATAQLAAAGVSARLEVSTYEQAEVIGGAVRDAGVRRLGLEADHVTWGQLRRFTDSWFPGVELVPTRGLVEVLRRVKDAGEVARIEAAAAIADQAFDRVRHQLEDEPTEREFALELDSEMRRLGAEGTSFETIVGSGPNGARPHLRPTDRQIRKGDLVVIDFGAVVDGYCSDMTRTLAIGEIADSTQRRMLQVVLDAQAAGVAAVAAGVAASAIDDTCRRIIAAAGWGEAFVHGTGHGVGLEIHEDPRVSKTSDAVVEAGNVITVEPGVYLPEHGGVRIEDTVVVTAEGCRALTRTPKTW